MKRIITKTMEKKENARTEYLATHSAYTHLDNFAWNVGGVLIAGTFVFWGLVFKDNTNLNYILAGNLLICLMMSTWRLYAAHCRHLYLYKFHRIHKLEFELGMYQNRGFKKWKNEEMIYETRGLRGNTLNDIIYIITSFGGMYLCLFRLCESNTPENWVFWTLLYLPWAIVLGIIIHIFRLDKSVEQSIANMEIEDGQTSEGWKYKFNCHKIWIYIIVALIIIVSPFIVKYNCVTANSDLSHHAFDTKVELLEEKIEISVTDTILVRRLINFDCRRGRLPPTYETKE